MERQDHPVDLGAWFPNVVPGERWTVTLKVVLDEGIPETLNLREDRFPAGTKPASYAALPAAFRSTVDHLRETQRRTDEEAGMGPRQAKP